MIHYRDTYDERYNQFVVRAMNYMHYDAVTMGQIELKRGPDYVRDLVGQFDSRVVVSNVRPAEGQAPWEETAVVKVGDRRVGILGLVSPDFGQGQAAFADLGWVVDDPFATTERLVPELRKESDIVVALAHLETKELNRYLTQAAGVDLVVAGWNPTRTGQQPDSAVTYVLRSGMRGEFVGLASLGAEKSGPEGRRAAEFETIMLKLETIGEDPTLAEELAEIKSAVAADQRKAQLERELQDAEGPILGQDRYLGGDTCLRCHLDDYEWWTSAPHSRALATLADEGRDKDESCLPCHVTGFGAPGGYKSVGTTADMGNVQCESCHGMGTLHDWTGETANSPGEGTCRTCHVPEWSPDFDYKSYLKRLGHGS